jgi:hypothetical protein
MSLSTVQHVVLKRACEVCGGLEKLSKALHVPMNDVQNWLDGEELAPTAIFNKASQLIQEDADKTSGT